MPGEEPSAIRTAPASTGRTALRRTRRGLTAVPTDRVAVGVLFGTAVGYTLVYLVAIGELGARGAARSTGGLSVTVARSPLARALAGDSIALVGLGPVEYLFAPTTLAVAVVIGLLVGANLALSALAWRRPAACEVSPASGLLAGLPALLSGTACCGPLVFFVLGLQATSAALTAVAWLRPVAILLLVASLLWAGWRLDVQPPSDPGKRLSAT